MLNGGIHNISFEKTFVKPGTMLIETLLRGDPLYNLSNKKGHFIYSSVSSFITLGPPLPKTLSGISMLEIHGDAFVFGGIDSGYNYNSAIYQLTCSSGICSLSTLNQELTVGRWHTVAIPVPDTFCV
jgi:hypothetical protein